MELSNPAFLQGLFSFTGEGLESPVPLAGASYRVPFDKRAQLVYFRAGNSAQALITLVLLCNTKVIRYFPVGASSAYHVALAVTEDIDPESVLEIQVLAPKGLDGTAVVDIGFIEI